MDKSLSLLTLSFLWSEKCGPEKYLSYCNTHVSHLEVLSSEDECIVGLDDTHDSVSNLPGDV
jgi:hypothetical protein